MKHFLSTRWLLLTLAVWATPGVTQTPPRLDDEIRVHAFGPTTRACLRRFSPHRPPTLGHLVRTRKTIWILDVNCSEKNLAEIDRFLRLQFHLSLYMTEPEIREYTSELERLRALPPHRGPDLDSWVDRSGLSFAAILALERPYGVHKIKEVYRLTHGNLGGLRKSVAREIYGLAEAFRIRIFASDTERHAFFDGRLDPDRRPLSDLSLPGHCLRKLQAADIWNVDELDETNRDGRLASLPGFGAKCRASLRAALAEKGWTLPEPDGRRFSEIDLDDRMRAALRGAGLYDVSHLREFYLDGELANASEIGVEGRRVIEGILGIDLPRVPYLEKIILVSHGIKTMNGLKSFSVTQLMSFGVFAEVREAYRAYFGRDLYYDSLDRDIAEGRLDHLLKIGPILQTHLGWTFGIRTVGDLLAALRRRDTQLTNVIDRFEPELRRRIEHRLGDCGFALTRLSEESP